jgi:hypothetical protein
LGRCEAVKQLENYIELVDPKHKKASKGKINDACGIMSHELKLDYEDKTPMAVILVSHAFGSSSNIGLDDHEHDDDLPHCEDSFPVRLAVLTSTADDKELTAMATHFAKVIFLQTF